MKMQNSSGQVIRANFVFVRNGFKISTSNIAGTNPNMVEVGVWIDSDDSGGMKVFHDINDAINWVDSQAI
jgi:hypothetical protein